MESLIDKLVQLRASLCSPDELTRLQMRLSFIDTLSVVYAGWMAPVIKVAHDVYKDVPAPFDERTTETNPEHLALVWGAAAHALDYDDVHIISVTHPSAVLIPAITAVAGLASLDVERIMKAYSFGLATNAALGEALGSGHYAKGWHATSTIGPIASAAALSHYFNLDERSLRSALSLAASQSAGMQRNFGTMAKPLQAGLAAAAGVRSSLLARSGLEAAEDPFGKNGFIDLYRGAALGTPPEKLVLTAGLENLSRKLYPCCYLAHRPIAAALAVRESIDPALLANEAVTIEVQVPHGCSKALRIFIPETGLEAKFSGNYAVATALLEGRVGLDAFENATVRKPEVQGLLRRVVLTEDKLTGPMPVGIKHGTVRIAVKHNGEVLARSEVRHYPGSPDWPATESEIKEKMNDCLSYCRGHNGPSLESRQLLRQANRFADIQRESRG